MDLANSKAVPFSLVFLPLVLFSVPLPPAWRGYLPKAVTEPFSLVAFWSFVVGVSIICIMCTWTTITQSVGSKGRTLSEFRKLFPNGLPKLITIIPVYNEEADNIMRNVDSSIRQEYDKNCMHICVSFDDITVSPAYLEVVRRLCPDLHKFFAGNEEKYPVSIDFEYQGVRVTLNRFLHKSKRNVQKKTFYMLKKIYEKFRKIAGDKLYLLFADSDCELDKYVTQTFMHEMVRTPFLVSFFWGGLLARSFTPLNY